VVETYRASRDIEVLTSNFPIPGYGLVPINAFVIKGSEPILVDTGCVAEKEDFLRALRAVIDPSDLRWLWLTHTDFDHIGSLHALLAENPKIRVISTFLSAGIMSLSTPLPMNRLRLAVAGQKIAAGDRTLVPFKPPSFDNPATMGFYDETSGVLFSSDCFGAMLSEVPQNAADLADEALRDGQVFWATLDAPWLHKVDRSALARELEAIRSMAPTMVLSSHLPAAGGHMTDKLLASLASAPGAQPFTGPDQAALEQMLAQMTGATA
jgi:flavorubredoxin